MNVNIFNINVNISKYFQKNLFIFKVNVNIFKYFQNKLIYFQNKCKYFQIKCKYFKWERVKPYGQTKICLSYIRTDENVLLKNSSFFDKILKISKGFL